MGVYTLQKVPLLRYAHLIKKSIEATNKKADEICEILALFSRL